MQTMTVNGPGRKKLGQGRHPWQWPKHAWLYSDLLQAFKGEHFSALGSQQMSFSISFSFSVLPSTPLWGFYSKQNSTRCNIPFTRTQTPELIMNNTGKRKREEKSPPSPPPPEKKRGERDIDNPPPTHHTHTRARAHTHTHTHAPRAGSTQGT